MPKRWICPECEREFDEPGVEEGGELYCCAPCSQGELCVCAQPEEDRVGTDIPIPGDIRTPGPL